LIINHKKKGKTFIKELIDFIRIVSNQKRLCPRGVKELIMSCMKKKETIGKEIDRLHKNTKPPETTYAQGA